MHDAEEDDDGGSAQSLRNNEPQPCRTMYAHNAEISHYAQQLEAQRQHNWMQQQQKDDLQAALAQKQITKRLLFMRLKHTTTEDEDACFEQLRKMKSSNQQDWTELDDYELESACLKRQNKRRLLMAKHNDPLQESNSDYLQAQPEGNDDPGRSVSLQHQGKKVPSRKKLREKAFSEKRNRGLDYSARLKALEKRNRISMLVARHKYDEAIPDHAKRQLDQYRADLQDMGLQNNKQRLMVRQEQAVAAQKPPTQSNLVGNMSQGHYRALLERNDSLEPDDLPQQLEHSPQGLASDLREHNRPSEQISHRCTKQTRVAKQFEKMLLEEYQEKLLALEQEHNRRRRGAREEAGKMENETK